MKAIFSMALTLMLGQIVFAGEKLEVVRDVIISKNSNSTTVFFNSVTDFKNITRCDIVYPKRNYDRILKEKSLFDIVSVSEPKKQTFQDFTLAEIDQGVRDLFGVGLPVNIKSVEQALTFLRTEYGIDRPKYENYVIKFQIKSETTDTLIELVCSSNELQTAGDILGLLSNSGRIIAPTKKL